MGRGWRGAWAACGHGTVLLAFTILLGGCAAGNLTRLYQMEIADDAAVVSATTLYRAGHIDRPAAEGVLGGATAAETLLRAWDRARANGDAAATSAAAVDAQKAMATLDGRLAALSPAHGHRAGQGVSLAIAIIQLVAELTPAVADFLAPAISRTNVTEVQVLAEFATLDADLETLRAALQAAPAAGGE